MFRFIDRISRNFGAQVFAALTVLIFLICISFTFLLVRFQYDQKLSELEHTGKLMAEMLAYQSRLGLYSENEGMLRVPVESLLKNKTVMEVCLFSQDARPVMKQDRRERPETDGTSQEKDPGIEGIVNQLSGSSAPILVHGDDDLVVWAPVMPGNSFLKQESFLGKARAGEGLPIGYVRITLGKASLERELLAVLFNSIALGLAFWAAGAFIAYFLVKQFHQPIKRLTNSVRRFGKDGICEDLPVETKNEIGNLARAFREMVDSRQRYLKREIDTAKELAHTKSLAKLGTVASKVTHEVGNFLNSISMVLPTLRAEPLSPKSDRLLMLLEKETDRTKNFILNFLQFARKPNLNMRKASLDQAIREILAVYQDQADQCGIDLILDWPDNISPLSVDHHGFYQVLNNLIKNSIAAIERNGTVKVSGRVDAADLVIWIEDSGPGIDPSIMDNLFEPFFSTKGNEGTGLGLSIARGIVQAHGGSIFCESASGEGTRFVIRLPIR